MGKTSSWIGCNDHRISFDVSEHLNTPEVIAAHLVATFEEADGDAAFIAKARPNQWIKGAVFFNILTI